MEVKKIKKLKNGKYKLQLDNDQKIVTYDEVILNHHLLYDKNIDEDSLNKIQIDTNYYDIYSKVLNYMSTRMRSRKEIIEYLNRKRVDEFDSKKILDNLVKLNLVNDEAFSKAYISDKIYLNHYGRNRIKKELLEHDISEEIIEKNLSLYDDDIWKQNLKSLIEKRIKTTTYSGYILKQKLIYEFSNQGYDRSMIQEVLEEIELPNHLQKGYDKIYQQLSKKYSGEILQNKIKTKLYAKGYSSEEINEICN